MTYIIFGKSSDLTGQRIAGYIGLKRNHIQHPPYTCMAWIGPDEIEAAVLFNDFTGANIEMHVQAQGKLSLKKLKIVLNYVFVDLGCKRLTVKPHSVDKHLARTILGLRFLHEATLKDYYLDGDAEVCVMTRTVAMEWLSKNA